MISDVKYGCCKTFSWLYQLLFNPIWHGLCWASKALWEGGIWLLNPNFCSREAVMLRCSNVVSSFTSRSWVHKTFQTWSVASPAEAEIIKFSNVVSSFTSRSKIHKNIQSYESTQASWVILYVVWTRHEVNNDVINMAS